VNAKTLERVLILRTMLLIGATVRRPRSAIEIADRASTECDHDLLEGLPEISRRGIGQKLNAMSLAGLVGGIYDPDQRLMFWWPLDKGRELAASIDAEGAEIVSAPIHRLLDTLDWTPVDKPEGVDPDGLYATHEGVLEIGGARLRCYQLSDGQRVFDAGDVAEFFGAAETTA